MDPLSDLSNPPPVDVTALLTSGGQVQLAFTMPGSIIGADLLATQNGSTISWSFKVDDPKATIFAESSKG